MNDSGNGHSTTEDKESPRLFLHLEIAPAFGVVTVGMSPSLNLVGALGLIELGKVAVLEGFAKSQQPKKEASGIVVPGVLPFPPSGKAS